KKIKPWLLHKITRHIILILNDPPTTKLYTLSLHDALPICRWWPRPRPTGPARPAARSSSRSRRCRRPTPRSSPAGRRASTPRTRSEEHTSELQSRGHLVCRLLLEKKK